MGKTLYGWTGHIIVYSKPKAKESSDVGTALASPRPALAKVDRFDLPGYGAGRRYMARKHTLTVYVEAKDGSVLKEPLVNVKFEGGHYIGYTHTPRVWLELLEIGDEIRRVAKDTQGKQAEHAKRAEKQALEKALTDIQARLKTLA